MGRQLLLSDSDAEGAVLFNRAMIDLTCHMAANLLDVVGLRRVRRIVDVGGGSGALLSALLATYPAATGLLFDLDSAIDSARAEMTRAGVADRCELIARSCFDAVPAH